jgi:hypothetical protein
VQPVEGLREFDLAFDQRGFERGGAAAGRPEAQALHLGKDDGVLAAGLDAGDEFRSGGLTIAHARVPLAEKKVSAARFSSKSLKGSRDGGRPLDAARHPVRQCAPREPHRHCAPGVSAAQ